MRILFLVLFSFVLSFGTPGWLPFGSGVSSSGGASDVPPVKLRTITKVVRDTLYINRVDTVVRVDTLKPSLPVYYNYTIYYEVVDKELSFGLDFKWDFKTAAQKTQLQSSDTTLFSLGKETLREASFSYDKEGNKTQTYEKIIEGLDMRVNGRSVNISYRTEDNLLMLNGRFDNNGLLMLSSDFSKRRYFLYFVPLDFLFGSKKYTLFLRIEKSGVM